MSDETTARIEALEARLRQVEDEQAITRLLTSYGPLVDAGAADEVAEIWALDGVYDVEGMYMDGRRAVHDMVTGKPHQGLIHRGSAHFNGPAHVTVTGDTARAVCHSLLIAHSGEKFFVARAGSHLFALARTEQGWQVTRRTTRLLNGQEIARHLLRAGVTGVDLPDGH